MEKNYRFQEIEHTADIAIRVWGRDLAELFANAAYGMACQIADPDGMVLSMEHEVDLEAYDVETLLVTWLGELLYLGEREEAVFPDCQVLEIADTRLRAIVRGGVVEKGEYHGHIKAVTFSNLNIECTDVGCETTIVFDV